MTNKILFTFLFFLPVILLAQNKNEELIKWSSSNRLTWNDYKGTPDQESDAAASTTTYLIITYNMSSNNFRYKIESNFSKSRSWGLHKTDYILSHEQGHFDIAEIFARKLNKEMSTYHFNKKTYRKDLSSIYRAILDEKEEMQNNYDKETDHSINKAKQVEWLKKIQQMLEEFSDYANY